MDMEGSNGPDYGARGSRRYIITAVEASLRRLRTDHIDLLQMHEPDPLTPVEETLSALDALVRAGKVRYVGSSNFAAWQVVEAEYVARRDGVSRFVSAQNRYSLLSREPEAQLVPACERYGIGLIPYFPLESGLLTGKYRRGEEAPEGSRLARERYARILREAPWDVIESLEAFARGVGRSMLEVAVGGLAARPTVSSVIVGAMTAEQVRANAAAGEWEPSSEQSAELARLATPTAA
jgi:aryl-alcohol dehydrogenase-like predicted oxidoreductase